MTSTDDVLPSCLARAGDSLHHADGTHKTTAATTRGRDLERHERAIRKHLADVALERDQLGACEFPEGCRVHGPGGE